MAISKKVKKRRVLRTKKVGGVKPDDGRECIERLATTDIDEVKKRKLCNVIIGIEDETQEKEIVQSWQEFTHLIFNDGSIIEEILKKTSSTEVCFLNDIVLEVNNYFDPSIIDDKTLKTLTFVYSHVGKTNESRSTFDPTIYYDTNVAKCVSKYMAIPLSLEFREYGRLEEFGHANMLIFNMEENESGLKIIKVEHFEPHGHSFGYDLAENTRINKFIDRLVYLLFIGRDGINSKDQIEIVHPDQLCRLKQTTNSQLQQLLDGTEFNGTCTFFSLWYSFYRLLYPSLTSEEVYQQMNDRLLNSKNRTETIKMIVQTFLSLVNIDIDSGIVSKNREIDSSVMTDINFKRGKLKPDSEKFLKEFMRSDLENMKEMMKDGKITNVDFMFRNSTPLMVKTKDEGTIEEVKWLLDHGANVNAQESRGYTALHIAVQEDFVDKVRLLLKYGADENISTIPDDLSPLEMAKNKHIKRLLTERADLNNKFHESDIAGMQKMMEEGKIKNVDGTSEDGLTTLMTKLDNGTIEEMKWLLDHGANVNIQKTRFKFTPLVIASMSSQSDPEKVRLLLDYGADRSIKYAEGNDLVDDLKTLDTEKSREIIQILQTYFPEKKGGKKLNRRTRRRKIRKR